MNSNREGEIRYMRLQVERERELVMQCIAMPGYAKFVDMYARDLCRACRILARLETKQ